MPNTIFCCNGIQITAPIGKIFVPGLVCQFFVTLCNELHISYFTNKTTNKQVHKQIKIDLRKVYHHEIIKIYSNAILLACAGVTDGQLLVFVDPKEYNRTIKIIAMASNPSVNQVLDIFQNMINEYFSSCIFILIKGCPYKIDTKFR